MIHTSRHVTPFPLLVVFTVALCSLVSPRSAPAQLLPPDPRADWRVRETEHFILHFPPSAESLSVRLGTIAEDAYDWFEEELGLTPPGRVEVFLQDSYDLVNSAATPVLHRSIYIFPNPPYGLPHALLSHYSDWLTLAFVHEYAHIVDLELRRNLWDPIHVVTKLGYPNLLRPLWTIEGFAVWIESRYGSGGRIGSPTAEMILRTDALAGIYRRPEQWSGARDTWPGSELAYIYGGAFLDFVSRTDPAESPTAFRQRTSGALPWKYAQPLQSPVAGKAFRTILAEFFYEQKEQAERARKWIESQGPLVEGDPVFRPGTVVLDLLPNPDAGLFVAYVADDRSAGLLHFDTRSGEKRELQITTGLDVRLARQEGRAELLFSDVDLRGNSRLTSRLYRMDASGRKRRASRVGRLHEPAASPNGMVLACQRELDRSRLVSVYEDRIEEVPTSLPRDADIFHPAWSPDGSAYVVAVWQQPGVQDVWLVEHPSGRSAQLTHDRHWDSNPVFTPDGDYVLFSSDRTGIWNVYALKIATRRLFQVTHVTSGAFIPEPSPDGKWLYFVRYSSNGDEIRRLPLEPATWRPVERETQPALERHQEYLAFGAALQTRVPNEPAVDRVGPSKKDAWHGRLRFLDPIARIPILDIDEAGLSLGLAMLGQDPLGRHPYAAQATYGLLSTRVSWSGAYQTWIDRYLVLSLAGSDLTRASQLEEGWNDQYWRRAQTVAADLSVPLQGIHRSFALTGGVELTKTRALTSPDADLPSLPAIDFYTGRTTEYSGGLSFSNAKSYPAAFSLVDGVSATGLLRVRDESLGGERTGTIRDIDARAYLRLADGFVGAVRGSWIDAGNDEFDFGRFGDLGVTAQDSTFATSRAVLGAAELRFRIAELQSKVGVDWIYTKRMHGAVFFEYAGYATDETDGGFGSRIQSVGGRLAIDMTIGFVFPLTFGLVAALPSPGDPRIAIEFSQPF